MVDLIAAQARLAALLCLSSAAVACGSQAHCRHTPAPPSSELPADEPAAQPALGEPIELDTPVECQWRGAAVGIDNQPLRLCFEPGGPCYAEVHAQATTVFAGAGEQALLDVVAAGFRLRGKTPLSSIRFYPQFNTALEGYHFANEVELGTSWRDVTARMDLGGSRSARTHYRALTCEVVDLRPKPELSQRSLENVAAQVAPDKTPRPMALLPGKVPMSTTPTGPPVAELALEAEPYRNRVLVLEVQGDRSRLLWDTGGTGIVHGWVPSAALGARQEATATLESGSSRGSGAVLERGPEPGMTCTRPVPLFARVAQRTRRVGQVFAGTPFKRREDAQADLVPIAIPDRIVQHADGRLTPVAPPIQVLEGASLLLRRADLGNCTSQDQAGTTESLANDSTSERFD